MLSTTSEACRALNISKVRLNELARKGKAPRGPKPNQWDIDAIRAALGRNLDGRQVSPAQLIVAKPEPVQDIGKHTKDREPVGDSLEPAKGTLLYEQWRLTREKASREALDLKVAERKLLDVEDVRAAVSGMVIAFRAKALVIGDSLADKLAATSDPIACRELVDARVYEALESLVEYPASAA